MDNTLSNVETEIINALRANNGTYNSAYGLIVRELGRSWAHGYRCLDKLERRGLITMIRLEPPHPTVIKLAARK